MVRPRPRVRPSGALVLATLLLGLSDGGLQGALPAARADDTPRHATLRDFQPTGKFVWEALPAADAAKGEGAAGSSEDRPTLYFSARGAAYLLKGPGLASPVLLRTGTRLVQTLPEEALLARDDGTLDLRADAAPKDLGKFAIDGTTIRVEVEGIRGRLVTAPHILGWQKAEGILKARPEYGRDAKAYRPVATDVEGMLSCKADVRLFVYFGTWCPTCVTVMGHILRLEDEIVKACKPGETPRFHIDYYGLPPAPDTWKDAEAVKYGLSVLPTALLYVDGEYCSRLVAADLMRPEAAIRAALAGR